MLQSRLGVLGVWGISIAMSAPPLVRADAVFVNGDCGDDSWTGASSVCAAPSGPKRTIQAGIDAAANGDLVSVADGVYAGPGNRELDFAGKLITLRSQNGAASCIIDCQSSAIGFYFHSGETTDAVVDGFTIWRGVASYGGGIYCLNSSPTIRNCIISGCAAGNGGGGIACENSEARIVSCTIRGNYAAGGGGTWFRNARPTLTNCAIIGNRADIGGGIYAKRSRLSVTNCTISGNWTYFGGGLWCESGHTTLNNCTLSGNMAWEIGKAIVCVDAEKATITNCILWTGFGSPYGQITLFGRTGVPPLLTVTYSDIEGGQAGVHIEGGAVPVWGAGNIERDPVFLGGSSGTWTANAVYDPSALQITFVDANADWTPDEWVGKPIRSDSQSGEQLQFVIASNTSITITVWADWRTIRDGAWRGGAGYDYQIHDYHLTLGSPCIDAGDPDFVPQPGETDIDRQMRIWNVRVDMGADEYGSFVFGDINCDGEVNAADIEPFLLALFDPSGYAAAFPDCDISVADVSGDGAVDAGDIEPFINLLFGS